MAATQSGAYTLEVYSIYAGVYAKPHLRYEYAADKDKIPVEVWALAVAYFNNVLTPEVVLRYHRGFCKCRTRVKYQVELIVLEAEKKVQLIAYGDLCADSLNEDLGEYEKSFHKVDHLKLVVDTALSLYNQRELWEHDHPMLSRIPGMLSLQMNEELFEKEHPRLARLPSGLLKLLGIKHDNS